MLDVVKKPLKAYKVLETCESTGGIVFAKIHAEARRNGAAIYGDGDWDSVECFRAPEFDRFAETRRVPDIELWRAGWWFHCQACERRLSDDGESDREPTVRKGTLYCSPWCVLDEAVRRGKDAQEKADARRLAEQALPEGCVVIEGYRNTHYHRVPVIIESWRGRDATREFKSQEAKFTFPGAQGYGRWVRYLGSTKHHVTIERRDLEAWHAFRGAPYNPEDYK